MNSCKLEKIKEPINTSYSKQRKAKEKKQREMLRRQRRLALINKDNKQDYINANKELNR